MNTDMFTDDHLSIAEIEKIHNLFEGVSNKTIPISYVYTSEELMKLENLLNRYKQSLAEKSPTAQLWLQYLEYVEIFIRAERTGDWNRKNAQSVCCHWAYQPCKKFTTLSAVHDAVICTI